VPPKDPEPKTDGAAPFRSAPEPPPLAAPVPFTKVHGLGNDYLYLDGIAGPLPPELPALARAMSDRHFGPGADGLITIERGTEAPLRMRIWNADGSEAQMCGNGLRGFAKLCYERGYVEGGARTFPVETGAGVLVPTVFVEGGRVRRVRVDMGEPRLRRGQIPMVGPADEECLEEPMEFGDEPLTVTAVSMGNPHAVIFVEDVSRAPVRTLGPRIERDPCFPERVNVEFVQVLGPERLRMRVWERGSGETLACGTGACAALVAAVRTGRSARRAVVELPGGDLEVEWAPSGHVFLTGPAVEVYSGVYDPH
jgi:diaminopimelate epimerase